MKKLGCLALMPLSVMAQELPDETWVCLAETGYSYASEPGAVTEETQAKFIVNPARGFKKFEDLNYVGLCTLYSDAQTIMCVSGSQYRGEYLEHISIFNGETGNRFYHSWTSIGGITGEDGTCSKI